MRLKKYRHLQKIMDLPIVGEIPRSDEIIRCEDQGKTVIEGNPDSEISRCFYDLAEILWKDEEQA